jgi:hypothetical protein
MSEKKFDVVSFIMDLEEGVLEEQQVIEGFQELIDSGVINSLQGSYQRAAYSLIDAGLCLPPQAKAA